MNAEQIKQYVRNVRVFDGNGSPVNLDNGTVKLIVAEIIKVGGVSDVTALKAIIRSVLTSYYSFS
jgi:hypothetical protein